MYYLIVWGWFGWLDCIFVFIPHGQPHTLPSFSKVCSHSGSTVTVLIIYFSFCMYINSGNVQQIRDVFNLVEVADRKEMVTCLHPCLHHSLLSTSSSLVTSVELMHSIHRTFAVLPAFFAHKCS